MQRVFLLFAFPLLLCAATTGTLAGDPPVPIEGKMLVSDPDMAYFLEGSSDNIVPAPLVFTDGEISPSGDQVAYDQYVCCTAGGPWPDFTIDMYVAGTDGSNPVNLSALAGLPGMNCYPIWSPDGSQIAFTHTDVGPPPYGAPPCEDPGFEVWVMDVDGSSMHQVSPEGMSAAPDMWSPNGYRLLGTQHLNTIPITRQAITIDVDGSDLEVMPNVGDTPRWSPDGLQIASNWLEPGVVGSETGMWRQLRVTAADGSNPQVLVEHFLSDADIQQHLILQGMSPSDLFYVQNFAGPRYTVWSPKGDRIAFIAAMSFDPAGPHFRQQSEVWMYDIVGDDLTKITETDDWKWWLSWTGDNTFPDDPEVTVDNATVTFSAVGAEGGLTTIIVTDELPAPPPDDLTFVDDFTYHLSTTATISGTVTVAVDYGETAYPPVLGERLSLLLWDGAQWVDITTAIDSAGYVITGQFSPDSESDWYVALALDRPPVPEVKVVFAGCSPGKPFGPGMFVADADFSNAVRLSAAPEGDPDIADWWPRGCQEGAWSPDGTRLVSAQNEKLAVMDLRSMIRSPGQEHEYLRDEFGEPIRSGDVDAPSWSPTGDSIAYIEDSAEPDSYGVICLINADGTGRRALYSLPATAMAGPEWSPDGTRFAFAMDSPDGSLIYVLEGIDDPGGPAARQVTSNGALGQYDHLVWSPDGTSIVFPRWNDIWRVNPDTYVETQVTATPDIYESVVGWCPHDGYIYFVEDWPAVANRMLPDGTGQETLSSVPWNVLECSWAHSGVWLDGLNALPGESVSPELGIADAETLAGVQAKVRYTGGSNTLTFDSILKAESILDWAMPSPAIGPDVASFLAYASDPETQAFSGAGHLFDLNVTNSLAAQPGDLQLLTFDDLKLSDDWGDPIERVSFAGGVHTIPFAYLEVSSITGPVCGDSEDPVPVPMTIVARDREGQVMAGCTASLDLSTFGGGARHRWLGVVSPTSVTLTDGVWAGEISVTDGGAELALLASWEDIGGYSNWFQAIGKGDANADHRLTIFDVIKVANMAIERGTWEPWQWWAGDVNGDHEVNIFDVIEAANAAMDAMEAMGIGRAGAPPIVAPPTEPVTVTMDVSTSGSQVVVAVKLSNCAGLAGVQVELEYDTKKLDYTGISAGELLTGASSWSIMGNDLGGRMKAIAYTASAEVLSGGEGTILTFTFNQTGKGKAKVNLTSVELADVEGGEIPSQTSARKGGGKGRKK